MRQRIPIFSSIFIALFLISGAYLFTPRAEGQVAALLNPPFAGKISKVSLCCNGVRLQIDADTSGNGQGKAQGGGQTSGQGGSSGAQGAGKVSGQPSTSGGGSNQGKDDEYQSPIDGDMIFPWQNMIPIPFPLGWGLYQGWKLMNNTSVLGRTSRGGECILIYTYCEESEDVDYTILEMGTKQKEGKTAAEAGVDSKGSTGGVGSGAGAGAGGVSGGGGGGI